MTLTLDDLKAQLAECPAGGAIGVPYHTFADLFPPGNLDDGAHERALKFAEANGCTIEDRWMNEIVFFIKPKQANP
jgi:hypothetical protein